MHSNNNNNKKKATSKTMKIEQTKTAVAKLL